MHLVIHCNVVGNEGFSIGPREKTFIPSYVILGVRKRIITKKSFKLDISITSIPVYKYNLHNINTEQINILSNRKIKCLIQIPTVADELESYASN